MKSANIELFYQTLSAQDPEPEGELHWINVYTLLVAVVCSAQATDISVNKATRPLFKIVTTPQAMLNLGEGGLKNYIRSVGLFNTKAKNVIKLSHMLIDEHARILDFVVNKDVDGAVKMLRQHFRFLYKYIQK